MKLRIQILLFLTIFSVALVACSTQTTAYPSTDDSPTASALTSSSTTEPAAEPTAVPQPTSEPTAGPDPTIIPTQTPEGSDESADDPAVNFNEFVAQAFDIQLAYPDGWLVTEDPELGLIVESSEGFFESMSTGEGAAVLIFPRDELADEEIVEALRQSVFDLGPPPTIFIEYPIVTNVGDHDVASAAYREDETGAEGFYVFIQNENQGVFVFATSTGLAKAQFLGLLEATIGTIVLSNGGATS